MDFAEVLLIAVGLSMDALAVAIGRGAVLSRVERARGAILMALAFGAFQALMPVAGWLLGSAFADFIGGIDHWIAFLLLAGIGARMIYEAVKGDESDERTPLSVRVLLLLAVATSIDALAVGIGLRLADPTTQILVAGLLIGVVTFGFSLAGGLAGSRLGERFGRAMEALGGAVLIGIGLRILITHLAG
ncbi:MAG: manganese efflux pump MntP family protein [Methanospirillum sp.]